MAAEKTKTEKILAGRQTDAFAVGLTSFQRHAHGAGLLDAAAEAAVGMDRNAAAEAEAARKQVSRLSLLELADLLQSRRADWVVRDMALQRLLVITRNGGIEAETPLFKQIVSGLAEQIPDLRSQVVRSACAAIVELSCAVGDHSAFDRPLREVLLPTLIDLVSNGNKVLANAGKEALLPLFTHCHFQGMLKLLATSLKESKHPSVKHSCCICLAYAIQFWPKQVLSPLALLLEETLVQIVADASADVRSLARHAIVAYSAGFSDRSLVVAMQLDANTRQLVEEESSRTPPPPESDRHRLGSRTVMRRPPGRPAPGFDAHPPRSAGSCVGDEVQPSPIPGSRGRQRLRQMNQAGLPHVDVGGSGWMTPLMEDHASLGNHAFDSSATDPEMARGISLLKSKRRSLRPSDSLDSVSSLASPAVSDVESPNKWGARKVLQGGAARRGHDIAEEPTIPDELTPSPSTRRLREIDRAQEALLASLRRCDGQLVAVGASAEGRSAEEGKGEADRRGAADGGRAAGEPSAPPVSKPAASRQPALVRKPSLPRTPPGAQKVAPTATERQAEERQPQPKPRRQLPRTPPDSSGSQRPDPLSPALRPARRESKPAPPPEEPPASEAPSGRAGRSRVNSGVLNVDGSPPQPNSTAGRVGRPRRNSRGLNLETAEPAAGVGNEPGQSGRHSMGARATGAATRTGELPAAFGGAADQTAATRRASNVDKLTGLKEKTPAGVGLKELTPSSLFAHQQQAAQAASAHPAQQQWTPEQQLEAMRLWQAQQALAMQQWQQQQQWQRMQYWNAVVSYGSPVPNFGAVPPHHAALQPLAAHGGAHIGQSLHGAIGGCSAAGAASGAPGFPPWGQPMLPFFPVQAPVTSAPAQLQSLRANKRGGPAVRSLSTTNGVFSVPKPSSAGRQNPLLTAAEQSRLSQLEARQQRQIERFSEAF